MPPSGPKWSCPCGTLNHADWDVCVDCGELRPVLILDPSGAVRPTPRRPRSRRWLEEPLAATVGVGLCFVSGALIAFAVHPADPARRPAAVPIPAVAVGASTPPAADQGASWVPTAAVPPPPPVFQVGAPAVASPLLYTPQAPGMEFSRVRENVPPPTGLYVQSSASPLPALQTTPPPAVAAPPAPPAAPVLAEQVVAHVRGSLLRIEAETPTANRRGTGFVVGPRLIATCAHLVQGTSGIAVTQVNGQVLRARVERLDLLNDLALLSTQGDLPPALYLDLSGRVEPGEPIAVTGFPSSPENPDGQQDLTMMGTMLGWVTRNSPTGERVQLLQITADVRHGHSGGPVYSLRDGRVLGLISFRVAGESVSGFAAGMPMLYELWRTRPTEDGSATF